MENKQSPDKYIKTNMSQSENVVEFKVSNFLNINKMYR